MSRPDPRTQYTVRYRDGQGRVKEKHFPTNAKLQVWLDAAWESGAVSEVLAFADPDR